MVLVVVAVVVVGEVVVDAAVVVACKRKICNNNAAKYLVSSSASLVNQSFSCQEDKYCSNRCRKLDFTDFFLINHLFRKSKIMTKFKKHLIFFLLLIFHH